MQQFGKLTSTLIAVVFLVGMSAKALAENYEIIVEECGIQLQMTPSACTCIADSADEDLTDLQQELLVAQVTEDDDAMAALAGQFTVADMTTVGEFMTSAPQTCAGE